jgi:recombination protein RecT
MPGQQRAANTTSAQNRPPQGVTPADQAVERARPVRNALDNLLDHYATDLTTVMPRHMNGPAFLGMAAAYVRRDPYLSRAAAANPLSLVVALREMAALGHMPMKGTAALVAYSSDRQKHPEHNGFQIQMIEEVGGAIQRILRAGGATAVHADVVRQKDTARFNRTRDRLPVHEYDEYADPVDRGPLMAVYAYATMLHGGDSAVVWMPKAVVMKHRKVSRSGDQFWGPAWPDEGPWTEDMWKKTAIHKLSTLIPSSAEYRWELAATEAAAAAQASAGRFPNVPVTPDAGAGYIDAESWPATAVPGGAQES